MDRGATFADVYSAVRDRDDRHAIDRAYDSFDAKADEVWDRLLCDGRKVTAVGGSDAHCPEEIGSAWTGVFSRACDAGSIVSALARGQVLRQ